jgi:integrase
MKGNITRRGERSWRLKYDLGRDPSTGKRLTRLVTVHGTKRDAQAELTRQLAAFDAGTLVEPSKATVESYLRA